MKKLFIVIPFFTFLLSQAEVVNIQALQRTDGSQIVDISYELLQDQVFETFFISIEVSLDGGGSWTSINNASGDFGEGITPGLKLITWNFGEQFNDTYSNEVKYKITAESSAIIVIENSECGLIPDGGVPFEMAHVPPGEFLLGGITTTLCAPEGEDDPNGLTAAVGGCAALSGFGFDCSASWAGVPISELCPVTCFDESSCENDSNSLDVFINADTSISGFQFQVNGATIVGVYEVPSSDLSISSNEHGVVVGFNTTGQPWSPGMHHIKVELSDNIFPTISEIVIAGSDACAVIQDDASYNLESDSCGSVDNNGDGGTNVLDLIGILNALGSNGTINCSDPNNDNQVDVIDLVITVHQILGNDYPTESCQSNSSMTHDDITTSSPVEEVEPTISNIDCNYEIMQYEVSDYEYVLFLLNALDDGLITDINSSGAWGPYVGDELTSPQESIQYINFNDSKISWNGNIFEVDLGYVDHPVTGVTYYGAYMFANYYGMELPSEFEWEKAARGMIPSDYPWGEYSGDEIGDNANYLNNGDPWDNGTTPCGYFNGENNTTDSPSPFGVYDMVGNVAEWVQHELNEVDSRMIRGGTYEDSPELLFSNINFLYRSPSYTSPLIGFRCIRRLPPTQ